MPQEFITRRTLLSQLLTTGIAVCQGIGSSSDPLKTIRGEHPRLILPDSELPRIRALVREHPLARKLRVDLEREADRILSAPLVEYKNPAVRPTGQRHRLVERTYILALLYRLEQDTRYLERAVREFQAAAGLRDWNPGHFLDTAEITHALAIGYDWLYSALTEDQRLMMRVAIIENGLLPGLAVYQAQPQWVTAGHSWSLVCNAGLVMGALAVAEDARDISSQVVKGALESIPRALVNYAPDGGWGEGPGYWHAGTGALVELLSSLESALDTDFGLTKSHGLSPTGRFRVYSAGPVERSFNFSDTSDTPISAPEMFWLARRFNEPVYSWHEQRAMERTARADALDLIWFYREVRSPQSEGWPLDAIFTGIQTAFLRSSWDDANGIYLAVHGGENRTPHAHPDLGAFILEAGGVRWAIDPGADPRTSNLVHNTLSIDGEHQDHGASAHISRHEFGPELSWVELDLSRVYAPKVKLLKRRIGIAQKQAIIMQDTLVSDQPVDALWTMLTDADVTVHGQTAELTKNGWTLAAEIHSPRHAVFDVMTVPRYKKLVAQVGPKITELDLNVTLTPFQNGQSKPKTTIRWN